MGFFRGNYSKKNLQILQKRIDFDRINISSSIEEGMFSMSMRERHYF